jgi:hypothetical protein
MTNTAQQLITRSYYLSGIIARDFETPTGGQIQQGLEIFNSLLNWKSIETELLPFYKIYNFVSQQGVEKYFIPNLFEVESLTFLLNGNVRYSSHQQTRNQYFGTFRVNNLESLPLNWRAERVNDGTDIYLYFVPQQNYPIQIVGKFGLLNVTLNTDLEAFYDKGYITYLDYILASYLCDHYGGSLPENTQKRLESMERKLTYTTTPDLSCNKSSVFNANAGFNWGYVNIGKGYIP